MACGRSCLAVHERYAACIGATRLSANTRPSHTAGIRFARRAACRIDRGETGFGTNVSPVSVHAHARRIESWECRIFSARIPALLALVDTAYGPAVAEETREETRGESLPPFACLQTTIDAGRMTRITSRQDRLTVRRACTYAPRRGRPRASSGGALCCPRSRPQDRRQDVSDPGSGTQTCSRLRPGGRSRPGCRCGSHPCCPLARSAWCRSRGAAAPTRHPPRHEVGT